MALLCNTPQRRQQSDSQGVGKKGEPGNVTRRGSLVNLRENWRGHEMQFDMLSASSLNETEVGHDH